MKLLTVFCLLASATAFAPSSIGRPSTSQNALADRIFGMDLFAPVKDQNEYGARTKKNLKQGKLTGNSYIPSGLTKAQYEAVRKGDQAKKDASYKKAIGKAFKFTNYTEWYMKRGTDLNKDWKKSVTLGHSMAKTKFDWSGVEDAKKFESTSAPSIFGAKKTQPVKKTAAKKKFF